MILVRHSQPELDPGVDCMHWRLSAEGRVRAGVLAERIRPLAPDALYSSPEPKAFETAEILGAALDLKVTVIADLREHDRVGVPFFTELGEFEEQVRRLFAFPDEPAFGTESAAEAFARFQHGIAQVLSFRDCEPLLVTHGTVMSLYIAAKAGVDAVTLWRQLSLPCYVVLDHETGGFDGVEHLSQ
jgi:broad specificity phosphatase PhoE